MSLGLPSELEGEPPAVGGTNTNSSLVTVDTDSVEPLTLPREELSSMIAWDSLPARPTAAATLPTRQTCYTGCMLDYKIHFNFRYVNHSMTGWFSLHWTSLHLKLEFAILRL